MTITSINLIAHELVGLHIKVEESPDPTLNGLAGIVKNETRNTISLESQGRLVIIPKDKSSFTFNLPNGEKVSVEGSRLKFRPEDRVKRGLAKW